MTQPQEMNSPPASSSTTSGTDSRNAPAYDVGDPVRIDDTAPDLTFPPVIAGRYGHVVGFNDDRTYVLVDIPSNPPIYQIYAVPVVNCSLATKEDLCHQQLLDRLEQ